MKISKTADNQYELSDGEYKLTFSYPKFEDMYYSIPLGTTAFLRLLLDDTCNSHEERQAVHAMLSKVKDKSWVLDDIQKQLQNMGLP